MQILALISFVAAILGSTFDSGICVDLLSDSIGFLILPSSSRNRLIFKLILQSLILLF